MLYLEKKEIPKMLGIFLFIFCVPSQAADSCQNVIVKTLSDTDIDISGQVSRDNDFELHVKTNLTSDGKSSILIRTELLDHGEEDILSPLGYSWSPLYFSVGQSGYMKNWQVPDLSFPENKIAERVLFPLSGEQKLKISVSTDSSQIQRFNLKISTRDFLLKPDEEENNVKVSPNAPRIFKFNFQDNYTQDNFIVKIANSSLTACTIVSVQKAQRSQFTIFDEESNIRFNSSYQTMLQKSAIFISRNQYPQGLYLILLGKSNNDDCYKKHIPSSDEFNNHIMNVTVVVESLEKSILTKDIVTDSIIFVIVFYFCLGFFFLILTWILDRHFNIELESKYGKIDTLMKQKRSLERERKTEDALTDIALRPLQSRDQADHPLAPNDNELQPEKIPLRFRRPYWFWNQEEWNPQEVRDHEESVGQIAENNSLPVGRQTQGVDEGDTNRGNVDENSVLNGNTNGVSVDNADNKEIPRFRPWVFLSRFGMSRNPAPTTGIKCRMVHENCKTIEEYHRQHARSQLFSWLVVLAGIFYGLPAFQLVLSHQNNFFHGGDLDICYYNFLCIFPLGIFADFGHFFSNIGYIISGLYFNIRVFQRQRKFEKISKYLNNGIPEQVGIFYALGSALTLEGILSAIYHICPTSSNFQFDTTFMYLIALLIFLKLYQFRHADMALTAQIVFLVIGIALILEVVGYFTSSWVFWAVFLATYMVFMLVFILKVYLNEKSFKEVIKLIYNNFFQCCSRKLKIDLRSLQNCFIVIVINILMAIFFSIKQKPGISRYLLAILMINMVMYEVYYIYRKLKLRLRRKNWQPNEGIRIISWLYLITSIGFMMEAFHFFHAELKTSAGTPAESRNLNEGCFLLIFDNHDMWHFLSAAGLYQHFMFLLTLEDNNIRYMKKRDLITVF